MAGLFFHTQTIYCLLVTISGWTDYPVTLIGTPSNLFASFPVHSCCNWCYGSCHRHTPWKNTTRQAAWHWGWPPAWSSQGCHISPQCSGLPLIWINSQTLLLLAAFSWHRYSVCPPFIATFCLWPWPTDFPIGYTDFISLDFTSPLLGTQDLQFTFQRFVIVDKWW